MPLVAVTVAVTACATVKFLRRLRRTYGPSPRIQQPGHRTAASRAARDCAFSQFVHPRQALVGRSSWVGPRGSGLVGRSSWVGPRRCRASPGPQSDYAGVRAPVQQRCFPCMKRAAAVCCQWGPKATRSRKLEKTVGRGRTRAGEATHRQRGWPLGHEGPQSGASIRVKVTLSS